MLGAGVVDGDDGIFQHPVFGHGAQADDAGGGLFSAGIDAADHILALGERNGDQIGAIIHGEVRLVIERRQNMAVVRVVVFALDGKDGDVVVAHQRGSNLILRRKRIGGAKDYVSAAIAQGDGQVGGLAGNVQAGGDAHALERLAFDEILADILQHLHGLIGPFDALLALIGQIETLDIGTNLRGGGGHRY